MPAVLCSGEIESKLPSGLTGLDIKSLRPNADLRNKYVQAIVDHRYQLNRKPWPSLKLVLVNSERSIIDLLAIGQVADDLDICVKGDILICLKFEVETCPGHYNRAFQMIVDDTGDSSSLVWIFKQSDLSKNIVQTKTLQSTTRKQSYSYRPLAELKVNTIVDVYGVVKFYKPPTKTKGSGYFCSVTLTDPSLNSPDNKLSCNLFSHSEAQLPVVDVGDVIRFHRLKIQVYQDKKQGSNGPGFQWLLFRGSVVDRLASSASYTFEHQDEDKVKSLLDWWQKNGSTMSSTKDRKKLSEVQPKDYFDLVCQVIRICDLEDTVCKLCRVWDGSKFEGRLKMAEEEDFNETVREDETLMEVSADLAVDVYLFDNHVKSADCIMPGDFIQFTNLRAAPLSDKVELTLHGGTSFNRGVVVLSRDSLKVKEMEAALNAVIKGKSSCDLLAADDTPAMGMSRKSVASEKHALNTDPCEKGIKTHELKNTHRAVCVEKKNLRSRTHVELSGPEMIADKYSPSKYSGSGLKLLRTSSGIGRNELTDSDLELLDHGRYSLEAAGSTSRKDQVRSPNAHNGHIELDAAEITGDDSASSIFLSAEGDSDIELQVPTKQHLAIKVDGLLQDSNISSSETSTDSQCLLSTNEKKTDSGNGSSTKNTDTGNCSSSPTCNGGPHSSQSSQESFYSVAGLDARDTIVVKTLLPETKSTQRTFLSLKRKLGSQEIPHDDDGHGPLKVSRSDVFSLSSSVNCFDSTGFTEARPTVHSQAVVLVEDTEARAASDSVGFTEVRPTVHSQEVVLVKDTEASVASDSIGFTEVRPTVHSQEVVLVEDTEASAASESLLQKNIPQQSVCEHKPAEPTASRLSPSLAVNVDQYNENMTSSIGRDTLSQGSGTPPRCMLKTASIVVGHTLVPRSSLKDVLEHPVPHKFKVLARIKEFQPRPATAANLVHFVCSQCHHIESAASLQVPLDTGYLEHVCPNTDTQPIRLQPTMIVTFVLCDEEHSLVAYLWDKQAVQFFFDTEPSQVLSSHESFHDIEEWLETLCPQNSSVAHRPLLECCLFSYGTEGNVRYQIFDTKLV